MIYYSTLIIYEHVVVRKYRYGDLILCIAMYTSAELGVGILRAEWSIALQLLGLSGLLFPLKSQCTCFANKEVFSSD